jgi:MraZ protein
MALHLTSVYELKIDAKNRLFIPVEVRKQIEGTSPGAAVYTVLGPNRMPWLYPGKRYHGILDGIPMDQTPDAVQMDYVHAVFSGAYPMDWDEQGRVVLPDKILVEAGIDKEVALAGCGDHLELWNRAAWEAHMRQLWSKISEVSAQWKSSRPSIKA